MTAPSTAPAPDSKFQIQVNGLHKSFGEHHVLKGVDLHIERGKINVVIGGSGAGKSVLMKHLIGLLKPDEGTILVESAPGEGTTFHIYLPIHERHAEVPSERPVIEGQGGTEVILVAEDEPMILDLAVLILRDAGYRVPVARAGPEAPRLYQPSAS